MAEMVAYWQSLAVAIEKLVVYVTPPKLTPVSTLGMARLPRQLSLELRVKVLVVFVKVK